MIYLLYPGTIVLFFSIRRIPYRSYELEEGGVKWQKKVVEVE